MLPSLAAESTFSEANFASRKQENVFESRKKKKHFRTQSLRSKHVSQLATEKTTSSFHLSSPDYRLSKELPFSKASTRCLISQGNVLLFLQASLHLSREDFPRELPVSLLLVDLSRTQAFLGIVGGGRKESWGSF